MAKPSIQFKPIKAKKYEPVEVRREIYKALEKEGQIEVRMFKQTTRTWRHKPKFAYEVLIAWGQAAVATGTDDEIYGYVSGGTRRHTIVPRNKTILKFRSGYKAKTAPRVIGSHKGGAYGKYVYAKRVTVKGIKPRRFGEEIQKRRKAPFVKLMQAAIDKGLKKVK